MAFIPTFRIRNFLLTQTDWTQVSDNGLTADEKSAWQVYRQALREIDINNFRPAWPIPPSPIQCVPLPPEWLMDSTVYDHLI